jgi:hypothetical protein
LCVVVVVVIVVVVDVEAAADDVVVGRVPAVEGGTVWPQVGGRDRGWGVVVKMVRVGMVAVAERLLLLMLMLLLLLLLLLLLEMMMMKVGSLPVMDHR